MQQLKELKKLKNISNLPQKTQLKYYKIVYFTSLSLLILMGFLSLGLTGSNFMIWKDLQITSAQEIMENRHNSFYTSQQMIIAFDVICLAMLGLLTFSVFKFYTKGNLIIIGITAIFWLIRWSASIFFFMTDSQLREQNEKKFSLIYLPDGSLNPLCLSSQCTGQLLNYVECGKILVWRQLESFQVGFLVITILVGLLVGLTAYKTNKLDVESGQEGIEFQESR